MPASVFAFAAIALAGLVLWPTFATLARYWREIYDYRHGFLIAATSLGWLWVLRRRMDARVLQPQPLAGVLLLGALLAWLLAYLANSDMGQQLLLPPVLLLGVWVAAGRPIAMLAAAPLLYLYFAIPVWDYTVPVLRALTVSVSEHTLALLGVPAVIRDYSVTIPEGTFQVVEGCAGKRYLVTALAMACLACAINGFSARRCAWFVPAAGLLAMVANWIRVDIIIYAGHVTNMQSYLIAVEHLTLGTAIFVVLLLAMIGASLWLSAPANAHAPETSGEAVTAVEPVALTARALSGLAITAALMIGTASLAFTASSGDSPKPQLGALPVTLDAWQGPLPAAGEWVPSFKGAADQARAAYRSVDGSVEVYINVYGRQSPGLELVQYENSLGTKEGWSMLGTDPGPAHASADGDELTYELAETNEQDRWILAHEYVVGSHATRSGVIAQVQYGATALTGPRPAGVIAFASRCEPDCDVAHALIASFWRAHGPAVRSLIPRILPGDRNVWLPTAPNTRDVEH